MGGPACRSRRFAPQRPSVAQHELLAGQLSRGVPLPARHQDFHSRVSNTTDSFVKSYSFLRAGAAAFSVLSAAFLPSPAGARRVCRGGAAGADGCVAAGRAQASRRADAAAAGRQRRRLLRAAQGGMPLTVWSLALGLLQRSQTCLKVVVVLIGCKAPGSSERPPVGAAGLKQRDRPRAAAAAAAAAGGLPRQSGAPPPVRTLRPHHGQVAGWPPAGESGPWRWGGAGPGAGGAAAGEAASIERDGAHGHHGGDRAWRGWTRPEAWLWPACRGAKRRAEAGEKAGRRRAVSRREIGVEDFGGGGSRRSSRRWAGAVARGGGGAMIAKPVRRSQWRSRGGHAGKTRASGGGSGR